jgi:ATP-dependent DNA helicase Q1
MDFASTSTSSSNGPSYIAKQRLNGELASVEAELASVNEDIDRLQALKLQLEERQQAIQRELFEHSAPRRLNGQGKTSRGKPRSGDIDYTEEFEWTPSLRATMKRVFDIQSFRLCQEGYDQCAQ